MALRFNEDPIFNRVKAVLISGSGMDGLKEAVRVFRSMDANDDNELDPAEWRAGLKKLGVKLTDKEANYLFIAFDFNKDGLVSINEFIRNLVGQLNPRRAKVVDRAFERFQSQGGPNVTISKNPTIASVGCDQLLSTFSSTSKTNPLVQSGAKSEAQLIREFAIIFDESRNPNGVITKEEFVGYYAALSTTVPFDDVFEAMVLKAWGIDEATAPRLGATQRDWSLMSADAKDPLQLSSPLLHTQALNPKLGDTTTSKAYNASHMTRQHPPFVPNPSVVPDYISTTKKDFIPYDEQERLRADPLSTRQKSGAFEPTATVSRAMAASASSGGSVFQLTGNPLVDGIRRKVLARSDEDGFSGLRRSFLVMGMGTNKVLQKQEARAALTRFKVSVTPIEFEQLWNYIERGTSAEGKPVTVHEFIRHMRGDSLNGARLGILQAAFDKLDTNGNGRISLPELAASGALNLKELPAVRSGLKTTAQALQDFIDGFDRNRELH